MNTQYPEYASPSIAARVYGVKPPTLRRWAKAGKIGFILTPGGQFRYDVRSHLALMSAASAVIEQPAPAPIRAPDRKVVTVQKPVTPKAAKAAAMEAVIGYAENVAASIPDEPEMTEAEIAAMQAKLAPKPRPVLPEGVELRDIDAEPEITMREWNPEPKPAPAPAAKPAPAKKAAPRKAPPAKLSAADLAAQLEALQARSMAPA